MDKQLCRNHHLNSFMQTICFIQVEHGTNRNQTRQCIVDFNQNPTIPNRFWSVEITSTSCFLPWYVQVTILFPVAHPLTSAFSLHLHICQSLCHVPNVVARCDNDLYWTGQLDPARLFKTSLYQQTGRDTYKWLVGAVCPPAAAFWMPRWHHT